MKFFPTVLIVVWFVSSLTTAFGAVDSYNQMVLDEIEYNRKLKLLEKQTEVLVRMERLDMPITNVSTTNNTSLYSSSKNSSKLNANQEIKK